MTDKIDGDLKVLRQLSQIPARSGGSLSSKQSWQHFRVYKAIEFWVTTAPKQTVVNAVLTEPVQQVQSKLLAMLNETQRVDVLEALASSDDASIAKRATWSLNKGYYAK